MHPIGIPTLSLNVAIDFLARVTTGFCPVMRERSLVAASMTFTSFTASPSPMLRTIFSSLGTCIIFV